MVYICVALYAEAKPIIEQFQMKQLEHQGRFKVYQDEEKRYLLIITGVGQISAAIAVSHICTKYGVNDEDHLMNIGSCAGERVGQIYLCHKIENQTNKMYYPDLIYANDFQEATVKTRDYVVRIYPDNMCDIAKKSQEEYTEYCNGNQFEENIKNISLDRIVYDMEAAGIYEAGSYFFGPHQMHFLKVVSDQGADKIKNNKKDLMKHFENIIQRNSKKITAYLEKLIQPVEKEEKEKKYLDEDWIEKICKDIHASQTMSFSLRQYMRYYALQGINYKKQFEDWYHEGKLPCKDKREGKKYFEQYKQQI